MSKPNSEIDPLDGLDNGRRDFLKTALAGTAVAVPVIVTVALTGPAAFAAGPNVSGATTTPETTTTTTTTTAQVVG